MHFLEIILLGIGLSMDAFAVAVCKGLSMRQLNLKNTAVIAAFFGGFQALMPLIGWLIGRSFASYIEAFDHWIAFALLVIIGGKMIFDAVKELRNPQEQKEEEFHLKIGELLLLAVATSIDALAVGLSFAMLGMGTSSTGGNLGIWASILLIGAITFLLSFAGVQVGYRFGSKYESRAEIIGGVVLILIGLKILFEHLGIISF